MRPPLTSMQQPAVTLAILTLVLLVAVPCKSPASVPSLERLDWMWSSVPVTQFNPRDGSTVLVSYAVSDHARLEWYNPHPDSPTAAMEHDLNPMLSNAQGGSNQRRVLEWQVMPPVGEPTIGPDDWTGLTQSISMTGADLSSCRFIEIWVNDFSWNHDSTDALLHLSLGRVSEDAFWSKTGPPNGLLDTEDKDLDGKLNVGDPLGASFEDTGLDGVVSALEPGYEPTINPDPNGDDYRYDMQQNPDDYSAVNNFELNALGSPFARPDTEDLNRDGFLELENNYFETTIDLARDTMHVAVDVARLYVGHPNVRPDNGWRLFRIPVSSETFRLVGSPSWDSVHHLRLWISDLRHPITLQIGGIQIDGFAASPAVDRVVLHQSRPNPFNPATTIPYELESSGSVRLAVFDIQGRLVRELVNTVESDGAHWATWSGEDRYGRAVGSGIYIYQITAGGKQAARRMVLVR